MHRITLVNCLDGVLFDSRKIYCSLRMKKKQKFAAFFRWCIYYFVKMGRVIVRENSVINRQWLIWLFYEFQWFSTQSLVTKETFNDRRKILYKLIHKSSYRKKKPDKKIHFHHKFSSKTFLEKIINFHSYICIDFSRKNIRNQRNFNANLHKPILHIKKQRYILCTYGGLIFNT